MDDLQVADTQDNDDSKVPSTIADWVTAQNAAKQSQQPPPAVAQMLKAQAAPAPATGADAQAASILGPQGGGPRMALASQLLHPSVGQSVGNAFAGLGDALANSRGGHTDFLHGAQQNQQAKAATLLDAADKDTQLNKEKYELSQHLQAKDPNSDMSKQAQAMYGPLLAKLGLDASKMSAAQIGDITGKGIDAFKAEGEHDLANQTLALRGQEQEEAIHRDANEAAFHKDMIAHENKATDATAANAAAERLQATKEGKTKAAEDVVRETSKYNPFNLLPGSDRAQALKTLSGAAQETQAAAPPYGQTTVRDGKTYEWHPDTQKYYLKG